MPSPFVRINDRVAVRLSDVESVSLEQQELKNHFPTGWTLRIGTKSGRSIFVEYFLDKNLGEKRLEEILKFMETVMSNNQVLERSAFIK